MADGSVTRSPEEWQELLTKMFPVGVTVTGASESSPQFTARPVRVFEDPDSGNTIWILGISESHAEYISLNGAEPGENGTLKVPGYGTEGATVRPSART